MDSLPDGPFALGDLAEMGLTRRRLRTLLETGDVRRMVRGVFVCCEIPDSVELRAAAAMLAMPAHTVVCDRSAAWLHGVDCFDHDEDPSTREL